MVEILQATDLERNLTRLFDLLLWGAFFAWAAIMVAVGWVGHRVEKKLDKLIEISSQK